MSTATFKTAIKYKGQFYEANKPFPINNNDIVELEAIGATVELTEEQEQEEPSSHISTVHYLEMSVTKLKTAIEAVTDIAMLESLIEQDERTGAKGVYGNRIEELKAAE